MVPAVGYSRPAIIRSVVVLPQPEGPSSTTNFPLSSTSEEPRTAVKSAKRFCRFWILISDISALRKLSRDGVADHPGEQHDERVAVSLQRPGLHQHDQAQADEGGGAALPGCAAQPARCGTSGFHLRIAPKVTPRSRCLRSS